MTITGTNLSNDTEVHFGATPATIVNQSNSQLVVDIPAGAVGTVDVIVTTGGGSSDAGHFTYTPLVNTSAGFLAANSTTLVISGAGFSTNKANDKVAFSNNVKGTVSHATSTTLTVTGLTGLVSRIP